MCTSQQENNNSEAARNGSKTAESKDEISNKFHSPGRRPFSNSEIVEIY